MIFANKRGKKAIQGGYTTKPCVITVWSPAGENTSSISLELSEAISKHTSVFLAELPCLSIPKLGFIADTMDRENHIDNLILELDKKGETSFKYVHKLQEGLAVITANTYSLPDFPIANRVSQDTLIETPSKLIKMARKNGYSVIVFECQGQLTNPMTFFAINHADYVLIPVNKPEELAFTLINIKRLICSFKHSIDKFKIVTGNIALLENHLVIKDDEGKYLGELASYELNISNIVKCFIQKDVTAAVKDDSQKEMTDEEVIIRL